MNTWLRGQLQIEVEEPLLRIGKGKTFFENSIVRSLLLMQTISFVALVGLFSFFLRPSKSLTVLHYNVYFGVDLLGAWWQTLILPGVSFVFVLVNLVLAYRFYTTQHERIAAYLLLLGSVMLLFSVALGCLSVVYINY
ncbi:MAG: hypothetical protein KBC83_02795 [Candidatus Moranbacteria bacterium]|nr:hypothetical protein [Candidatus Moranbacteria bacterium]MBP9801566.1 hypothetical protein [Candidatus Moranbacteria bacterium]